MAGSQIRLGSTSPPRPRGNGVKTSERARGLSTGVIKPIPLPASGSRDRNAHTPATPPRPKGRGGGRCTLWPWPGAAGGPRGSLLALVFLPARWLLLGLAVALHLIFDALLREPL